MRHVTPEYGFDNIFIVPLNNESDIVSRRTVDTSIAMWDYTCGQNVKFEMPIMLAPMSFFGADAIRKINNRFLAFLPRIQAHQFHNEETHPNWRDIQVRISAAKELYKEGYHFGVAISINDSEDSIRELSKYAMALVVDTANGYSTRVHKFVKRLKEMNKFSPHIICGNVVSSAGYCSLLDAGCDFIRLGIGSGSNCITSNTTAIGRPILTTIMAMNDMIISVNQSRNNLICDGGVKGSHDLALALLFVKFCMISGIFKYTELSEHYEAGISRHDGIITAKIPAYGMASAFAKDSNAFIEGKLTHGDMYNFEDEYTKLKEGLQSAMSYLGANNLKEYIDSNFELVHSPNY